MATFNELYTTMINARAAYSMAKAAVRFNPKDVQAIENAREALVEWEKAEAVYKAKWRELRGKMPE